MHQVFPQYKIFLHVFLKFGFFLIALAENIEYPDYDGLPFIFTAKLLWGVNYICICSILTF